VKEVKEKLGINGLLGNFFKMKKREEIQYHEQIGIPVEKI
jgi:hypothetical protein